MQTRYFALIMGIIFLVVGIAGFIPALVTPAPTEGMAVDAMHGRLFGLFPVNALHNLVHAAFGIWGIAAYRSFTGARTFAKVTAVIYAILLVMGFIPVLNTTFGLVPLYGHDIWLHALIAIAAAYFGFRAVDREAEAVPAEGRR
ncbi:DUF4383 domain-containing protein [Rhodospirillaceae bacterium SYSU D60014]|uniref:DUF4383 domain-containing protein n=1 Tax=Virgifigura deserti TaxID=2268457 RepID=UPI000E6630C9